VDGSLLLTKQARNIINSIVESINKHPSKTFSNWQHFPPGNTPTLRSPSKKRIFVQQRSVQTKRRLYKQREQLDDARQNKKKTPKKRSSVLYAGKTLVQNIRHK